MTPEQIEQMKADRKVWPSDRQWKLTSSESFDGQEWLGVGVEVGGYEFLWLDHEPGIDIPLARRVVLVPTLEAEVLRLREALEWRPIKTAPETGEFMAYWPGLHNDDWEIVRTWWDAESQTFATPHESIEHDHPSAPTHWKPMLPLPAPPPEGDAS